MPLCSIPSFPHLVVPRAGPLALLLALGGCASTPADYSMSEAECLARRQAECELPAGRCFQEHTAALSESTLRAKGAYLIVDCGIPFADNDAAQARAICRQTAETVAAQLSLHWIALLEPIANSAIRYEMEDMVCIDVFEGACMVDGVAQLPLVWRR